MWFFCVFGDKVQKVEFCMDEWRYYVHYPVSISRKIYCYPIQLFFIAFWLLVTFRTKERQIQLKCSFISHFVFPFRAGTNSECIRLLYIIILAFSGFWLMYPVKASQFVFSAGHFIFNLQQVILCSCNSHFIQKLPRIHSLSKSKQSLPLIQAIIHVFLHLSFVLINR